MFTLKNLLLTVLTVLIYGSALVGCSVFAEYVMNNTFTLSEASVLSICLFCVLVFLEEFIEPSKPKTENTDA